MKLYMFRTVPLSIIRSLFTVHSSIVYVIQVCRQLSSRSICSCIPDSQLYRITSINPGPARKLSTNLCDIYHCWVYSEETPDNGQTNCPKPVEFHDKIKFVKLVHLVGFIIKKLVTIHGHMNVKFINKTYCRFMHTEFSVLETIFACWCAFHSFSILSDDWSKASSKTIPPHSAI